jgi:hypothetical protein
MEGTVLLFLLLSASFVMAGTLSVAILLYMLLMLREQNFRSVQLVQLFLFCDWF